VKPGGRIAAAFFALAIAAGAAFALELAAGPAGVPLSETILCLAGRGAEASPMARQVVLDVRLPRAVMGGCVGALLALAGVLLQGFLRNPLAEPYLLGVSSGAGLAVTIALLAGVPAFIYGIYTVPLFAFAGALVALVAVYLLAQFRGRLMVTTLVLAGVVVSSFLSALIMLLASTSTERFFEVFAWLMGHLQPVNSGAVSWISIWTLLGLAAVWAQARDLNALMLGEEEAVSLGVRVEPFKRALFLLASLLTGAAVAVSGLIGFVGLVAPHAARLMVGSDHRRLIPASALTGAVLLLLSDTLARLVVAPAELPVGVVTALVGGPFFLVLLLRHARELTRRPR